MYCSNCGTALPEDSCFCTNCGTKVLAAPVEPLPVKKASSKKKTFAIVLVCAALAIGAWLVTNQVSKTNLQKQLMKDWSRVERSDSSYYTLELDFSEDEVEYIFDSFYITDTIKTYDYEIISGNQIKIDGHDTIYTIEFNDDKTMMTITPALTSTDSSESWFNHDD